METNSWGKFSEYGLIGLVVGALLFLFYRWSVWIMGWIKERDKEQAEERMTWVSSLDKHNNTLNKISESIEEHDKRADERGRYVRSEHEKIIENLVGQGKILARINGYKKE